MPLTRKAPGLRLRERLQASVAGELFADTTHGLGIADSRDRSCMLKRVLAQIERN
jgi:hypothetical protein